MTATFQSDDGTPIGWVAPICVSRGTRFPPRAATVRRLAGMQSPFTYARIHGAFDNHVREEAGAHHCRVATGGNAATREFVTIRTRLQPDAFTRGPTSRVEPGSKTLVEASVETTCSRKIQARFFQVRRE